MRLRIVVVLAVLAALGMYAAPRTAIAATPTCHGQVATVVVGASHSVTVNDANAVIVGTGAADTIVVSGYNPLVCSLGGDDNVTLEEGGTAYLGTGNDTAHVYWFAGVYGESGDDYLIADYYGSYANGGSGDDQIYAYYGSTADGGSGDDYVYGDQASNLYGSAGKDSVEAHNTFGTVDCGTNYDHYTTDGSESTLKRCEEEDNPCACTGFAPGGVFFSARAAEFRRLR